MAQLLRKLLLINHNFIFSNCKCLFAFAVFLNFNYVKSQIVNYASNGSFELLNPGAVGYTWDGAKYWGPLDSNKISYYLCTTTSTNPNVPYVSTGFQFPRTGNSFAGTQFYCSGSLCNANNSREYLRNRLKTVLQPNKTYCAKYFVVNTNNNIVAIDAFGAYFGDSSLDTIKYCMNAITYLNPQINYSGPIITDTLNWTVVTGTFVANGTEKYMVLGNFKSNAQTNTLQINPTNPSAISADIYIDDVSVIDIDLPAYAYSSNSIYAIPGSTLYLGRPQDVGIDEACMWYKLPNTTTAIDTVAGITITVAATTETYMVKQDICGVIKYDTVVVHPSGVGDVELGMLNVELTLLPNPANDEVEIQISNAEIRKKITNVVISNSLGQEILAEKFNEVDEIRVDVSSLDPGIYWLSIKDVYGTLSVRKLVIEK